MDRKISLPAILPPSNRPNYVLPDINIMTLEKKEKKKPINWANYEIYATIY
jgi:hypothetical protein